MPNIQGIIMFFCFSALAIVNFIFYVKLTDYLYICAGITKKDAKKFISAQGTNSQRRLVTRMRYITEHPKEFEIMLAICKLCSLISFVSVVLIFISIYGSNYKFIKIAAIVLFVLSAAAALFGFSYGKKSERNFEKSFSDSEYTPRSNNSISEDIDGPYNLIGDKQEWHSGDMYGNYFNKNGKTDKYYRIFHYIFGVIMVLIILAMASSVLLHNHDKSPSEYTGNTQTADVTESETTGSVSAISAKRMKQILEEEGFSPFHRSEEIYGDFILNDLVAADKDETHFEYFVLDTQESAAALQESIEYEVSSIYGKDGKNDTVRNEYRNGFDFYSIETNESCAAVIRTENNVIYTYCDKKVSVWLNNFLASLGYSDIFEVKGINTNAFAFMFAFAVLSILSRFAFSWIKRLSYAASGQTQRSVEEHFEQVKAGKAPYEKELQWLAGVSPRPQITKTLYYLFYVLISLGIIGLIISVAALYFSVLNDFLNKAAMSLTALCILSGICQIILNEPIIHIMNKSKKK